MLRVSAPTVLSTYSWMKVAPYLGGGGGETKGEGELGESCNPYITQAVHVCACVCVCVCMCVRGVCASMCVYACVCVCVCELVRVGGKHTVHFQHMSYDKLQSPIIFPHGHTHVHIKHAQKCMRPPPPTHPAPPPLPSLCK